LIPYLRRRLRPLIIALITSGICLTFLALSGYAVRSTVLGRLRDADPAASVGRVSASPGLVLLEDLRFPSLGLRFETVVAWWSGNPISPDLDSLLISGCRWSPDSMNRTGHGQGGGGTELPPARFTGLSILHEGRELTCLCGSFAGGSTGRGDFMAVGEAGLATGSFRLLDGTDSLRLDWFRYSGGASWLLPLPAPLRARVIEGSLSAAVGEGAVEADGSIASMDGQPARSAFHVSLGRSGTRFSALFDLAELRDLMISATDSLLGGCPLDLRPSGLLEVEFLDSDTVRISADAALDSIMIFHPALSGDTVFTNLFLRMEGTAVLGTGEVRVDSGVIGMGTLLLGFSLEGRFSDPPRLALRVWNPCLRGEDLSASLPAGLLGSLEGLRLGGEASVDLTLVLDWGAPDSSDFRTDLDVSGLTVLSCPVGVGGYRTGGSCRMRDSWGGSQTVFFCAADNPSFVPFESLHPCLEGILKCAEDASFRSHSGFSELQIRSSIQDNMERGAFVRGGSTITMQLARNLMLGRDRNLARKLQEAFLTWRLEENLGKDRILEIYCNIVELGPGTFGFQEGAWYYFGADLGDLTTREVAFLVSVLPGPALYYRFYRDGTVPGYWNDYLDRLVTLAGQRGWIPQDSVSAGLEGTLVFRQGG
jgi:hypothetical protein